MTATYTSVAFLRLLPERCIETVMIEFFTHANLADAYLREDDCDQVMEHLKSLIENKKAGADKSL